MSWTSSYNSVYVGTNFMQCDISSIAVFSITVNYHKKNSFSGLQVGGGGVTVTSVHVREFGTAYHQFEHFLK